MTSPKNDTSRINRRSFLRAATLTGGGAAILAGGGFAMRGSASSLLSSQTTTDLASPEASPQASPAASPVAAAAGAIEVIMVDIAFQPTELSIPANTDVQVGLVNQGVLQHNFVIDELGVASPVFNSGQSGTVTINAAPGQYQYYCSVPGHKEAGMVGVLTVT